MRVLRLVAALALVTAAPAARAADEYDVKAAFIYNFAKFIEWPPQAIVNGAVFDLCIYGSDPFGRALAAVEGKAVGTRALRVRAVSDRDAPQCQILFFGDGESPEALALLRRLAGSPVLTVSDNPSFARNGGIIRLLVAAGKVRFEINASAASAAGLSVSSHLMRLALAGDGRS